jgi:predicted transcriptional regulator
MFQSVLNMLFGCSHQRTTFPLTPARKSAAFPAAAAARTYVVCLDCGKEFAYNWQEMRVGAPVSSRVPAAEVQPSFR